MGGRGEQSEEETMSERRGGRGTHTLTKGFSEAVVVEEGRDVEEG